MRASRSSLPAALVEATQRREGEPGTRWLRRLPSLIELYLQLWGCELVGEPRHGEVAIVLPVRRGTEPLVLKISFPHPENRGEPRALRHLDGRGAVRVLAADDDDFALLLERAGQQTLASLHTAEEAIETAGHLARRLAVPAPIELERLSARSPAWEDQLDQQALSSPGRVPAQALSKARQTMRILADDQTATLLHGDLHFANVLRGEREPWLAIDPKGWAGTAAFDAFTVVTGRREDLEQVDDLAGAIRGRVRRYARAAQVDEGLALACCQARATSSYLYQVDSQGHWFDLALLRDMIDLAV